ncbi:MAG TPA: 4Fe-4S dicluster domain-containing protein [Anaerolineae bacterium]|nr:4Fe-4S dicluster domain-containing protein [Anaerolineae bacterium]
MGPDASQSYVMIDRLDRRFNDEVAALLGNLDLAYCFQCGVCSGSCPTVDRMEYGPRRIMHMVHLGLADQVLRSRDIWVCVSCFSCSSRCPQDIEICEVMSVLRNLSIARGVATDEEAAFSRTFVDVLQRYGRLYEMEVLLRYYASKPGLAGLVGLVKQAGLGMTMFRKGKIALRPEHIENTEELKELAAKIGRGERH